MTRPRPRPVAAWLVATGFSLLGACGGGGDAAVEIRVLAPSSSGSATVAAQEVAIGGSLSGAAYVHVLNKVDGSRWPGYVTYFDGRGTWMADVYGLALGPNTLEVVADHDGTGRRTASDRIVVTRTGP